MGLLPKSYDQEAASGSTNAGLFIKLNPGENKFRILGLRLMYQTWSADGKPIRYRAIASGKMQKPKALPFNGRAESKFGPEKWKHVWYCLVWSYADQELKVLEIPQSTVQKQLTNLDADDDWGDLSNYDVKIVRTGEKMETEYNVIGIPPKPINKTIKEALETASINMDAIVYNCYPDDPEWHDKALEKLLSAIELASAEARERDIELEIPTSTELDVLQTAYERAMDAMSLAKVELPKVEESVLPEKPNYSPEELESAKAELETVPF